MNSKREFLKEIKYFNELIYETWKYQLDNENNKINWKDKLKNFVLSFFGYFRLILAKNDQERKTILNEIESNPLEAFIGLAFILGCIIRLIFFIFYLLKF